MSRVAEWLSTNSLCFDIHRSGPEVLYCGYSEGRAQLNHKQQIRVHGILMSFAYQPHYIVAGKDGRQVETTKTVYGFMADAVIDIIEQAVACKKLSIVDAVEGSVKETIEVPYFTQSELSSFKDEILNYD